MCDVLGALHDIFITGCAEMVSLSQSERRISSIPQSLVNLKCGAFTVLWYQLSALVANLWKQRRLLDTLLHTRISGSRG